MSASPILAPLPLPLTTRRLVLRDYVATDTDAVMSYVQDVAYWLYQRADAPSAEQGGTLLQWVVKEQTIAPRLMYFLAAARKDTGDIVGEGVLKLINPVEF